MVSHWAVVWARFGKAYRIHQEEETNGGDGEIRAGVTERKKKKKSTAVTARIPKRRIPSPHPSPRRPPPTSPAFLATTHYYPHPCPARHATPRAHASPRLLPPPPDQPPPPEPPPPPPEARRNSPPFNWTRRGRDPPIDPAATAAMGEPVVPPRAPAAHAAVAAPKPPGDAVAAEGEARAPPRPPPAVAAGAGAGASGGGRRVFSVELRPGETTIVSWRKMLKEADLGAALPPPPPAAAAQPAVAPLPGPSGAVGFRALVTCFFADFCLPCLFCVQFFT